MERNKEKVAFYTLGCKVNSYDTHFMMDLFKGEGYEICDVEKAADVYVINTCSVTNESERKSKQMVRRFKNNNPNSIIVLSGCFAQSNEEEARKLSQADIILGTFNRKDIIKLVNEFKKEKKQIVSVQKEEDDFIGNSLTDYEDKTRASIKVQDGCNMYCAYCIIPYARGSSRSREAKEVIAQINLLKNQGIKEVVITGIHLASYNDVNSTNLIGLLEKIDKETGIERLRLGSLEPKLLSEDFLNRLSKIKSFCPHFHISLQSGSNATLKRMNRKYSVEEYYSITNNVRKYFPNASITTDIIVGFPGEDEKEFNETLSFVKKVNFSFVHIFPFSPKKGTKAYEMEKQVEKSVKEKRAKVLKKLAKELEENFIKENFNITQEVLLENKTEDNKYLGYTKNYIYVKFYGDELEKNQIVLGKITGCKSSIAKCEQI